MRLAGTLYRPSSGDSPAGVVYVHDVGADRGVWSNFAAAMQRAGYMGLAFDLRGHGDSGSPTAGGAKTYRGFTDADWRGVVGDVQAAVNALVEAGADRKNVALVGAGFGANAALRYAADDPEIVGVAGLSPGLELKGIRIEEIVPRLASKALLMIAAEGDSYAASTCTAMRRIAEGYCEVELYPGTASGIDLLAVSEGVSAKVSQWLDETVGPGHGAPAAIRD